MHLLTVRYLSKVTNFEVPDFWAARSFTHTTAAPLSATFYAPVHHIQKHYQLIADHLCIKLALLMIRKIKR